MTFDDFVLSLDPTGEPPDGALDELWTELRRILRRALQRRGLWDRPTSYLGVTGHSAWTTSEIAGRRGLPTRAEDALDELAADFYVEVFLKRLANLRRYALLGDDLVRIVHLAANQFLMERQRQSDPLGYRLFRWLRAALQLAVAGGRLQVLEGGERIYNGTVFSFGAEPGTEQATEEALAAEVRRWNDELFLDWVSAHSSAAADLTARLADHVPALREAGIEVFGFRALVDTFKRDVRDRLASLLGDDPEEKTISEAPLRADEAREWLDGLSDCVEGRIRDGGGQRRTQKQLLKLWRFLVDFALAAIDPEVARGAHSALAAALRRDDLPSYRELSRLLGIRHDRFSVLLVRLREEVEICSGAARDPEPPRDAASRRGSQLT